MYLTRQEAYLAQRFANLIEFQTAAMFRGEYSYDEDGDALRHGFTGGETTIDFGVPAGNLTQLDMLGGGDILDADWATAATDIPAHLHEINAAMIQLTGMGLAHVVVTSVGWQHIVNNTKVQDQGGTGGPVFERLKRVERRRVHGDLAAASVANVPRHRLRPGDLERLDRDVHEADRE